MADTDGNQLPDLRPLPGKQTGAEVGKLVGLMQRLLAPDGCPWDREQTLETLIPYLIEETYEVIDSLHQGSVDDHREELGDLLLQIVFQAELRHRDGHFGIDDVARGIVTKLVRRHPHVFGDVKAENSEQALASWARLKAEEKAERGKKGALHGIPRSAPALIRAFRTGEKAAAVGFDWPDPAGVREKVNEELGELDRAIAAGDRAEIGRELGDTLFALVNLARKLGVDAEDCLSGTIRRFSQRFEHMEGAAEGQSRRLADLSADEQNGLWENAKSALPED
jgi:tetrapyrrole methylase family protein / MazG family protein